LIVAILVAVLILEGCGAGKTQQGASGEKEIVRVGTDAEYPPFEKIEGNGQITGFDMDILKAIAKAGGFE
jgi:polar amino acid transport system substrate-binding protein